MNKEKRIPPLTPAMRAGLELKILRAVKKHPELKEKVIENNHEKNKTINPYRKDATQAVKAREALSNLPISLEQKKKQIAESFRIHGQQNLNKKNSIK